MNKTAPKSRIAFAAIIASLALCLCLIALCETALATERPARVTGLKASSMSKHAVKLTWGKANHAKKYQVLRSASKAGAYKRIATTAKRHYVAKSLKANKTYYFKVRAIRGKVRGRSSHSIRIKTKRVSNNGSSESQNAESSSADQGAKESTGNLPSGNQSIAKAMLDMVNSERAKQGIPALQSSRIMNDLAQQKAQDMFDGGYFSHESPSFGGVSEQLRSVYLRYSACGENIAEHWGGVADVMRGWMNSSGHRANILNDSYTHVGIGYYNGLWVQQFACITGASEMVFITGCPNCGKGIYAESKNSYHFYSSDAEGNRYGIFQCRSCCATIEHCPKCENGLFEAVGLNENGSTAYRCNACGNSNSKVCVTNCASCGADILGGTIRRTYIMTFDSSGKYNPDSTSLPRSAYFQQIQLDFYVCKTCGCIAHVDDYSINLFSKCAQELAAHLNDSDATTSFVFWEKAIGTTYLGNGISKYNYQIISTPDVVDLRSLLGKTAP